MTSIADSLIAQPLTDPLESMANSITPDTPDTPADTPADTATTACDKDPAPVPETLDDLVKFLHRELGDNGLDGEGVDVERIRQIMENYQSNSDDWGKYAHFDKGRYTRNLVDDGNGKFNLMILAWPETIGSAIHDHSGSHCLMKILDGTLHESLYEWPDKVLSEGDTADSGVGSDNSDDEGRQTATAMTMKELHVLKTNQVAYMHDKLGLHAVSNPLTNKGSVSLHLYTPPYETCKTFNARSSKARSSGKCVFYTSKGKKIDPCEEYKKCSLMNVNE